MLLPTDCPILDYFIDKSPEETNNCHLTVSSDSSADTVRILETFLKCNDKETLNVENSSIEVGDCRKYARVTLKHPSDINLENMISEDKEDLYEKKGKNELVFSDFTRNSNDKLQLILCVLNKEEKNIEVELDAAQWHFSTRFKDVLAGVITQIAVNLLAEALEQLLLACFEKVDELQPGSKLSLSPNMLHFDEDNFPKKCYRLGYALFCTKWTILDEEKQKILKQLKYFTDQVINETRNANWPHKGACSRNAVLNKVEELQKQNPKRKDVFDKVKYILDVQKYQEWKIKEELSFLMKVLHLVEKHPETKVTWPISNHIIVSPLTEVQAALHELERAIHPDNKQVVELLNRMRAEVHKHIVVKKPREAVLRTALHVPVYPSRCTEKVSCLIVNNIDFPNSNKHLEEENKRWGTNIDKENILHIFTQVGFDIFSICTNIACNDFMESLKTWKQKLKDDGFTSLILVVMSHGYQDSVIVERSLVTFSDNVMKPVQHILDMFTLEEFPVPNMPKIFLFQICRGKEKIAVPQMSSTDVASENILYTFPNVSDTLVAYGTTQGYVSHRFPYAGTTFISELCDVFRKHAYDTHLQDMLIIVNERMKHRRALGNMLQTCSFENYGFKHFYFTNQ